MPEITNRKDCLSEEINALKQFLKHHSPDLVQFIEAGAVVSKGCIKSRLELAKTNTEWYDIGGIRSRKEYSSRFFRVDQVMTVLKNPQCHDGVNLDKIQKFTQEIETDNFKSTITLFEKNNEIFIYDGNHSAVAFFEYYSKCGLDDINTDVYIITDNTKLRIFLIRCYNFFWFTLKIKKIQLHW
jgi:hypothetical protein